MRTVWIHMGSEPLIVRVRDSVRLDRYLTARLAHVSRSRIQRQIERGDVLVDGRRVRASHRLQGGEALTLRSLEERRLAVACEPVEMRIVYEDADLVVVDKPGGLLVHPVGGEFRRTLLGGLHHRLVERGEDAGELGLVHRLDRQTSGLIVVAKRLQARRALAAAVENRRVRRLYLGVAAGAPHAARGCIDLFIRRDPRRPTRMQALDSGEAEAAARLGSRPHVSESGYSDPRLDTRPRAARTHYRVLRTLYGATVLRLELETGRTHQIRAHLRRVGTPLLGDPIYGPGCEHGRRIGGSVRGPREEIEAALRVAASLKRPALHASDLEFTHPRSGESLRFRAPLPDDLRTLVHRLGGIGPAPVGSASAGPAV